MGVEAKMDSKRKIGAKDAGELNGRPTTLWAIDDSGEGWTECIGLAPRHDADTRARIHVHIEAAGYTVVEEQ